MVARGDYLLDHDRDQINLVEGGNVGEYILKITPYMNLLTVPLDNLRLEVKTSYCAMAGTPRSSFFKVFTWEDFLCYSWRLVTSNKTVEELDAENPHYENPYDSDPL